MSLTLVTTCKPFEGHYAVVQGNALQSWSRLEPSPEVLVFGDEAGVKDACGALGFRQLPSARANEFGTPLLDDLIALADLEASADTLALVNADIMLTDAVHEAMARVRERFDRYLLVVRRWNTPLQEAWSFEGDDWQRRLSEYARTHGSLEPVYGGVDVFIYPRGLFEGVAPFAIGRGRWDSHLIALARRRRIPVIDATASCLTVHQDHDYRNLYRGRSDRQAGRPAGPAYESTIEGRRNEQLLGGAQFVFTCLNATHVLDSRGLHRAVVLNPAHLLRRLATMPALYPSLQALLPLVRAARPIWRRGKGFPRSIRPGRLLPYPVSIARRHPHRGQDGSADGVETFEGPEAASINAARLEHLATLELPLEGKTVLDAGCGVGHLARFFVDHGCEVLCIDARPGNVERLGELYPGLPSRVFDVERQSLQVLGSHDVVFCYGLLYHLEDPFRAIRQLAGVCRELLILETQVADHVLPLVCMEEETATASQALQGVGCRPTPSFVALALREAGMAHVYAAATPPDHPEFRFSWRNDLSTSRGRRALRCVFIASRRPLESGQLVELLDREG